MTYVSTSEAAAVLGVTDRHVRLLLKQGKLKGIKVGRNWVVSKSGLEKFSKHPTMGRPPRRPAEKPKRKRTKKT